MTSLELLNQSLLSLDQQIATLLATVQPDYSVDGESQSLSAHLSMLMEKREKLVAAILQVEGPADGRSRGVAW